MSPPKLPGDAPITAEHTQRYIVSSRTLGKKKNKASFIIRVVSALPRVTVEEMTRSATIVYIHHGLPDVGQPALPCFSVRVRDDFQLSFLHSLTAK